MIRDEDIQLGKVLQASGYLTNKQFDRYQRMLAEPQAKNCAEILVDHLGINEDAVAETISQEFKIPLVNLTPSMITVVESPFSNEFQRQQKVIPVIKTGVELTVAMVSPPYKDIVEKMRNDAKAFIVPVTIRLSVYKSFTKKDTESKIDDFEGLTSKFPLEQIDLYKRGKEKIQELQRANKLPGADQLLEELIIRAIKIGASDVHFEPSDTVYNIRYNMDGVMERVVSLPPEYDEKVANIIRARAGMNVFDKRKPQDGRYTARYANHDFDFRVSIVPTLDGERICIRILQKSARIVDIHDLGFTADNLIKFKYLLRKPRGLLVVTGPAGSGKSTTAYAGLNEFRDSQKNILTVENPVEYRLGFASQVQVDYDQKLDFSVALRSILRQNPHVIFLGEMRDSEAGVIAAEAALTGNMVLSTMLSSDALTAIPRMLSLGIPPSWLAPTLLGIIYQQLVRKICSHCKEQYTPTRRQLMNAGLSQLDGSIVLFRGKGCEVCGGDGYLGRTAIHEVLVIDEEMRDLIFKQASLVKLREYAMQKGFESIHFDAAKKLITGIISMDEYLRVLG
ncbi:MAG: Flp pilus assembly complex ATPase component TadA [Bacteroidetes bacterium]|nr:Flp pilus assembly complex ATPase component TadA [Bacteroidota bacterium]